MIRHTSRDELEHIIAKDMPGYELVGMPERSEARREGISTLSRPATADPYATPQNDADDDDDDELFEEFFGDAPRPVTKASVDTAQPTADANGIAIVAVRRKNANPFDTATTKPRSVVVSLSEKKVIGTQG